MHAQTFDQFFQFRSHCLCGAQLITTFPGGIHMEDDYTCVKTSNIKDDGETINFLVNIDSRTAPYGEVDFLITSYFNNNSFELMSTYPSWCQAKKTMSADDFAIRHFTSQVQKKANIWLKRTCPKRCNFNYMISTQPLLFDMQNKKVEPIDLGDETFRITEGNKYYNFRASFPGNYASITYPVAKEGFILGGQETLELNLEKYLRYPLDREFLLNKVKTLLLFS